MPELSKDDLLSNLYYDLDKGYGSAQSLYKQDKKENIDISLEYVKNWNKRNNLINKEKVTKDTNHIKHHFHDLNTRFYDGYELVVSK